jgi:lantibiotic modifying enzyme
MGNIEVSLKTTRETDLRISDNLCCGNFGLVDILLTAAQKLSRPDLKKAALRRASWVVARRKSKDSFSIIGSTLPILGLFQGRAGIGYELLRLAYPDIFKSLLLFE